MNGLRSISSAGLRRRNAGKRAGCGAPVAREAGRGARPLPQMPLLRAADTACGRRVNSDPPAPVEM